MYQYGGSSITVTHRSMPKSTLSMTLHFMFCVNLHMIILLMLTYKHYYYTLGL